jgi:hypothetical protein
VSSTGDDSTGKHQVFHSRKPFPGAEWQDVSDALERRNVEEFQISSNTVNIVCPSDLALNKKKNVVFDTKATKKSDFISKA